VDWCASCGFYFKALTTLDPLGPVELLESDLATVALDLVATERGYRHSS
jgi:formate dehydrogenase maturation protein FdhE